MYRQAFGGLYYITLEQLLVAAKTRRLKLLESLGCGPEDLGHLPACQWCEHLELSPTDSDIIDDIQQRALDISVEERNTLFYIAGFLCKKEDITQTEQIVDSTDYEEDSEFLQLLSRGALTYPSQEIFQFCLLSYSFFSQSNKLCRQLFYVHHG